MYEGHDDQHFGFITYSQNGEDLVIVELFDALEIENPNYLDIGAHHPFHISNTAKLHARGSRGYTVDANPNVAQTFENNRPYRNTHIHAGILPAGSLSLKYKMFDDLSGRNTFSENEASGYKEISGRAVLREIEVPLLTLNQLVEQYCGGLFPEFLSLDVEGLDFDILNDADLSLSCPLIICVEVRADKVTEMTRMMRHKNYLPYVRMGENTIYVHISCNRFLMGRLGL